MAGTIPETMAVNTETRMVARITFPSTFAVDGEGERGGRQEGGERARGPEGAGAWDGYRRRG